MQPYRRSPREPELLCTWPGPTWFAQMCRRSPGGLALPRLGAAATTSLMGPFHGRNPTTRSQREVKADLARFGATSECGRMSPDTSRAPPSSEFRRRRSHTFVRRLLQQPPPPPDAPKPEGAVGAPVALGRARLCRCGAGAEAHGHDTSRPTLQGWEAPALGGFVGGPSGRFRALAEFQATFGQRLSKLG